jgi:hypothetical protein
MAELKDFLEQQSNSLSDFVTDVAQNPMWSRPSAQNKAAHSAILSDKPIETYDRVMGEMQQNSTSTTYDASVQAYKDKVLGTSRGVVGDVFGQENVSIEQKGLMADGYVALSNEKPSAHQDVIRQSIIEPVTGENIVAETGRIDTALSIKQINQTQSEMQDLLNVFIGEQDRTIVSNVKDLVQGIVPFVWNQQMSNVRSDLGDNDLPGGLESFVASGFSRADLRDKMRSLDDGERIDFAKKLIGIVNDHPGTILSDENKWESAEILRIGLENGYYSTFDEYFDSAMSILDSTIVLAPVARVLSGTKAGAKMVAAAGDVYRPVVNMVKRRSVQAPVSPMSPSQAIKEGNPEKARALHDAVNLDETGELAEATYGATRVDAMGHDIANEVLMPGDVVKHKVGMSNVPTENYRPDARVVDMASRNGAIYLPDVEKAGVKAKVINDFKAANGIVPRTAMFREGTIVDGVEGTAMNDRVMIRAVYGPQDGGFGNGADFVANSAGEMQAVDNVRSAADRVKAGLRSYGIDDDDIEILVRQGEYYQPVPMSLVNPKETNFLIQVKHDYKIAADDLDFGHFDVKWNMFDRLKAFTGNKQGSIQRHLLAPSSMLRKELTLGANAAIDQGSLMNKELLDLGKGFTDLYDKFDVSRKAYIFEEIKRANFEGKAIDLPRISAEGATPNEIKSLRKWKEYHDTLYYLENADLKKTLRNGGYQVLDGGADGTSLYARPIARSQVTGTQRVYDVEADEIVTLSKEEVTKLYDEGGHFSNLRSNMDVNGEVVGPEGIAAFVRNQAGGTISRGFRDGEAALNYRDGYYGVKYDAPYYVDKVFTKPNGQEYTKAVSVTGSYKDAERYAANQAKLDGGTYRARADTKNDVERRELDIQVAESGGRSAQRIRGERLEDATDPMNSGVDHQYVVGPVDSLISSARSISNRVATRDYLEAGKGRFLNQFKELLPKNAYGQPMWPTNISQIGRKGEFATKQLADAHTTFEYLHYLENGYINGLDNGIKAVMRFFAETAGRNDLSRAEKVAHALGNSIGPTGFVKNTAFNLYLVLNPARQFIVQGHQAVQLSAIHPVYAATRLVPDTAVLVAARMTKNGVVDKNLAKAMGRTQEEVKEMFEGYRDSGLSAAIDRQNLLNGSLAQYADDLAYKSSAVGGFNKVGRGLGKVLDFSRRVGFDAGEEMNMMTAWLAHYDKAKTKAKGRKLDQSDWDTIRGEARDFTYNMNLAGDMPYNQNWLGMAFQFMQVPHKALLQMSFNRNLTVRQKAQLIVYNTAMYGVPSGSLMYSQLEKELPEEGEFRDAVLQGVEAYTLNSLLSLMSGEETSINFQGLAASDMQGTYDFVANLVASPATAIMAASPSGSLLFGNNPKITGVVRTALKLTNFMPEDGPFDVTFESALIETLSLSSGFSNAFKARVAVKLGQHKNAYGMTSDGTVTKAEAYAKIFGFESLAQAQERYVSNEVYEGTQSFYTDIDEQYRLVKLQMARVGKDFSKPEDAVKMINWISINYEGDGKAQEYFFSLIKKDAEKGGDTTLLDTLINRGSEGVLSKDKFRQLVRSMPESPARTQTLQILNDQDELLKR